MRGEMFWNIYYLLQNLLILHLNIENWGKFQKIVENFGKLFYSVKMFKMYKTNIFPELFDCFLYFSIIFIVLGIQLKIVENCQRCAKNIGCWTGMFIYVQRTKLQIFKILYEIHDFLFLLWLEIEQKKIIENY